MYTVYKTDQLFEKLNSVDESNKKVIEFFNIFTYANIINQNIAKDNSAFVFKNAKNEDLTKSKIIESLNKLHPQNLGKSISMIRGIVFKTSEELNELVNQCIQKIKRDNDQIRPLVAALCYEIINTYFLTTEGTEIYFRKLLLEEVKKEYLTSMNFEDDIWTKDKAEKVMILIGTLFNGKIIDKIIMKSIINDFKKNIVYKENGSQDEYEKIEKCIQLLSCLISCIVLNEESKNIYENLDIYLENLMITFEKEKCITKKVRLVCKNSIEELRKI